MTMLLLLLVKVSDLVLYYYYNNTLVPDIVSEVDTCLIISSSNELLINWTVSIN